MGSLQEFDAQSRGKWSLIEHGENVRGALVLYFHDSTPEELLTSGDYISFRDFKRVQRSMGVNDEPLAMLYHKLALYFVGISNPGILYKSLLPTSPYMYSMSLNKKYRNVPALSFQDAIFLGLLTN